MNNITFIIDINDMVVQCIYHENIDSNFETNIVLPKTMLYDVLSRLIKSNPDIEPTLIGDYNKFTFYDVDVDLIDKLIEKSELYKAKQKMQPVTINKSNTEAKKIVSSKPNNKVNRVNKFKKTLIRTSASTLLALSIFTIAKASYEHMEFDWTLPIISLNTVETKSNDDEETKKLDEIFIKSLEQLEKSKKESQPTEINQENKNIKPEQEKSEENQNTVVEQEQKNVTSNKVTLDGCLKIATEDLANGEKHNIAEAYYLDSLSDIANRYGIDPQLALAVCIHERGIHSDVVDSGGAVGLFQIQVEGDWNWNNKTIKAYNFETNQYEEALITKESVSDVFENMRVGCMMLQELMIRYNYNVAQAVTAYNYGTDNVRYVLERCASDTGISMDYLNDISNTEWLKYRDIIKGGDPEYLEHVFKYIPNESVLTFTNINHETINIGFENIALEENVTL